MAKKADIEELANIISKALRHRIGSIVNEKEIYASKYAKDADNLLKEAERVLLRHTWNRYDKIIIKEKSRKKLKLELEKKDFIDSRKFDIMDEELDKVLKDFGLL